MKSTPSELQAWLAQGDVKACEAKLRQLVLKPGADISLGAWVDTAAEALQGEHQELAVRMVTLAQAHPDAFERAEGEDQELAELAQLLALQGRIPKAHQRALVDYMLGDEAPLAVLLERDPKACAATHAVLTQNAPLLASFFVVHAPGKPAPMPRDRTRLVLGLAGVVTAFAMLAVLFKYGSSWSGPALESPRRGPRHEEPSPTSAPEVEVHQSDDVFALRLALLRARPCVCESALTACRAINDFDRNATPSCALLAEARTELDAALQSCRNDEAREALSRACPTHP